MTSKEALAQIAEYSEAGLTVRGTSSIYYVFWRFFCGNKKLFFFRKNFCDWEFLIKVIHQNFEPNTPELKHNTPSPTPSPKL